MLTHANLLAVVAGQLGAINQIGSIYGQEFTPEDTMISYLPLAHIFDRCGLLLQPLKPWLHKDSTYTPGCIALHRQLPVENCEARTLTRLRCCSPLARAGNRHGWQLVKA